jgi:hypothetical protein
MVSGGTAVNEPLTGYHDTRAHGVRLVNGEWVDCDGEPDALPSYLSPWGGVRADDTTHRLAMGRMMDGRPAHGMNVKNSRQEG